MEPLRDDDRLTSRRRFMTTVWWGLGGLAFLEAVWVGISFLKPRRSRKEVDAGVVIAGPVERFEPESVTAFQKGKFYLVRLEDGGFLALHRECTHLGCTVPWNAEQGRFICPCHASSFDIHGEVSGPPAPRPLDLLPVRIENGIVKVDTSRRMRRSRFQQSQVVRS
jgi:cytochrome b6-f complex iron-sulfur subunit